jgi:hypothetical protein
MKDRPLIKRFRIENPKRFNLADHNPAETVGFEKEERRLQPAAPWRRLRMHSCVPMA